MMEILNKREGILHIDIASEGKIIRKGTPVVIEEIVDNFKNIFIKVTSIYGFVRLSLLDTDVDWLLGVKK